MQTRAFTLIELLIVVAIIAILAAIAVPNFLEAQVRAKVSRTKTDMRTIATGLESYRVDNNKYPPQADFAFRGLNPTTGTTAVFTPQFTSKMSTWLTTPIAYLSSVLDDVFIPQVSPPPPPTFGGGRIGYRYTYFNYYEYLENTPAASSTYGARIEQTGGWMFYSFGPDRVTNQPSTPEAGPNRVYTRYDPTNGTVSFGNIIRTQASGEGSIPFHAQFGPLPNTNGPN